MDCFSLIFNWNLSNWVHKGLNSFHLWSPHSHLYLTHLWHFIYLLSDILLEFLNRVWTEAQPSGRAGTLRKSSFEFPKRLASTVNTTALQSQMESVHKVDRQEIEAFSHLMKKYISSKKRSGFAWSRILDSPTLLSWYVHRFWKNLVRHIFPATILRA